MNRLEKINYLKAIQSGDKDLINKIESDNFKELLTNLSYAELNFLEFFFYTLNVESLKIKDIPELLNKYKGLINEYEKQLNSDNKYNVKFCLVDGEPNIIVNQ